MYQKIKGRILLVGGVCALLAGPVVSQPVLTDLFQRDALEQQRQSVQQQVLAEGLRPQAQVRIAPEVLPIQEGFSPDSSCYDIHHIALLEYTSFSSPLLKSQFQWALDKSMRDLSLRLPFCMGEQSIAQLMQQVQNQLIGRGYVTTRVVAPEQALGTGQLQLMVIPGRVGQVVVEDASAAPRFSRLTALTGLTFGEGDLLNIRDIEHALENFRRVPSAQADILIEPSAQVGVSQVRVRYQQGSPFRFHVGLDDAGSRSTGKYQVSGSMSLDNLLSANDIFYTSFTQHLKSQADERGARGSQSLSVYYGIPFGYWTLSTSLTYNRYHQTVFGAFANTYRYAGKSRSQQVSLSYLLYRDERRKTSVTGSLWHRRSHNMIDGAEIDVQRRRMAGWEVQLNHKEYFGKATLDMSLSYKRGTGARGELSAPEALWGEGTSRPRIIQAAVSWHQPFTMGSHGLEWHTSWQAQWHKTPLIAADRFAIGGRYTVRGFDGELSLMGERGWLWRNELAWHIHRQGHYLYAALDAGRVMGAATQHQLGRALVGAAIGVRGQWQGFYYDAFVGKPIRKPTGFKTAKTTFGFSMGYRF